MDGHYRVLGVSRTASSAQLRTAYLALARRLHPDRLGELSPADRAAATARMAAVNEAWSVLSDPARRAAYDQRHDPGGAGGTAGARSSGATIRTPDGAFVPFDLDDGPDPELLDDTPSGAPTLPRALTMLPAVLAAAGAGMLVCGLLISFGPLAGLGAFTVAAGAIAFLLLPLVAMINSSRADGDP